MSKQLDKDNNTQDVQIADEAQTELTDKTELTDEELEEAAGGTTIIPTLTGLRLLVHKVTGA